MATICKRTRRPTAPGEILKELYLAPRGVSIARFADAAGITRKHMSAIINGRATVTAESATRFAEVLGTTAQFWLNLQNAVDLFDAEAAVHSAARQPHSLPIFSEAPEDAVA